MESVFGIMVVIGSMLVPFLILAAIVGFVVYLVKNKDKPFSLNIRVFLNVYFYMMIFVIILIAAGGCFMIGKSGLSYAFGIPFSYELNKPYSSYDYSDSSSYTKPITTGLNKCTTGEKVTFDGSEYCFDKESQKKDMIIGITLIVSMSILLAIHITGLVLNNKVQPTPILKKIYLFISLGVYGLFSIIVLPISIYQVIDFTVYKPVDYSTYGRALPGQPLAWTFIVLPLWIYFLARVVMLREHKEEQDKQ
jgi:hypothetical protein